MIRSPRAPGRLAISLLVAFSLWGLAAPAWAGAFQSCSQITAGQHNCSDGTICVCSELPAEAPRIGNGYFWDCAPTNGTCGEAAGGPSAILTLVRSGQSASLDLSKDTLRRADIARLQARLNTLGFDGGPADGIIGPRTRDAIRHYQAKKGFMVDGLASTGLLQSLQ